MTLLSNHFYPGFYFLRKLLCKLLVDAAAGYGLPPSQSFYFLLWASRRLYCHNNNNNNNNNNNIDNKQYKNSLTL